MSTTGKHGGRVSGTRRLGLAAALAATVTIATSIAAIAAARPATPRPTAVQSTVQRSMLQRSVTPARGSRSLTSRPAAAGPAPLVLTSSDRSDCPAAATACVDLTRHVTWLQRDGKISFGPVRMEPGKPGTVHATPRGTFHVSWKAGPHYMSTTYHEPMPWATFFAAGGIAFHGGSLTRWSHGCVHLTVASALRYQQSLPIGAEVVVF